MYSVQVNGYFIYMYIKEFEAYLTHEKNYSKHTIHAYVADVDSFNQFLQEDRSEVVIDEAIYTDIRYWIVHLVDSGLTNRTINRKIASLKAYYSFVLQIGVREANPLAYHQPLKVDHKVQVPFSQKEMTEALKPLANYSDFNSVRNLLIISLLYATGIRRAELIGLKKSAVNLEGKNIRVVGKGNKERIIPLLPWCAELIKDYLLLRVEIPNAEDIDNLLLTERGKPIYPSLVYRVVKETFNQVSAKQTKSPHIIRHTFATHLLDEGADLMTIKELLGHTSLASTQVYTYNSMKKLKRVYNAAHPRNKNN